MSAAADELLDWYDANARVLPWRAPPGSGPADPYRVWLSEIMLQQTVVATVKPYFERFTSLWPTVSALADAPREDVLSEWAGLGYYARARNLHKCAVAVSRDYGGVFPDTEAELLKLPGVGPYTAGAVAAIAFNRRAAAIDGNVERVMTRLHAIEAPLPEAKPEIRAAVEAMIPKERPGDFAQAIMDLGATICAPRSPRCMLCPWRKDCAGLRMGIEASLPKKAPKKPKPRRENAVYALFDRAGRLLVETRPETGLLGGMIGLPGPSWTKTPPTEDEIAAAAPVEALWREAPARAEHVFTHFKLTLTVRWAEDSAGPPKGASRRFVAPEEALGAAPTVMRKAMEIALAARSEGAAQERDFMEPN